MRSQISSKARRVWIGSNTGAARGAGGAPLPAASAAGFIALAS
jgi:hypothetical protein